MTALQFVKDPRSLLKGVDTLLVLAPAKAFSHPTALRRVPAALRRRVVDAAKSISPGATGSTAESVSAGELARVVAGVLPNEVSRHNAPARTFAVQEVVAATRLDRSKRVAVLAVLDGGDQQIAVLNGLARALPLFTRKSGTARPGRVRFLAVGQDGEPIEADAVTRETAHAVRDAARLVDTPPTDLAPSALAREAREMLDGLAGVELSEIVGDDLVEHGLGGIHAVGRTALDAPRMLVAKYASGEPGAAHVALVGKGITYDTGGLNIKVGGSMPGMKADMGGAAAVLGAFRVLAKTGSPHDVSLVLCIAENAIGPASYKPDDVLDMHSGKTVEINNTDAEGRLLLADGVSYAARELHAQVVLDAATLTGAQLVATGLAHAGIVSDDEDLERLVVEAGRATGDLCHALPFAPELYQREFQSAVADMRNSVKNRRNAQSSCAAQFVYSHLAGTRTRWCHVDLAGPAFPNDRATGFGVSLLSEVVRRLPGRKSAKKVSA